LLKTNLFNYARIKHKQMSFVSNGGKFKLYTVLNGLIFPTPTQPRILFERAILNAVEKSKNPCGANDLSVTVIRNRNVMKNVCYLHHNGFLIFEQRLCIV
jgi:hypothetical protein